MVGRSLMCFHSFVLLVSIFISGLLSGDCMQYGFLYVEGIDL